MLNSTADDTIILDVAISSLNLQEAERRRDWVGLLVNDHFLAQNFLFNKETPKISLSTSYF